MATKIENKIVKYGVVKDEDKSAVAEKKAEKKESNVIHMHEKIERPEMLLGSTYKIKTPLSEHALYVTINDIILNAGTEHEARRPFEIFINSKNMDHFQWIVALTRIISAVFRKAVTQHSSWKSCVRCLIRVAVISRRAASTCLHLWPNWVMQLNVTCA